MQGVAMVDTISVNIMGATISVVIEDSGFVVTDAIFVVTGAIGHTTGVIIPFLCHHIYQRPDLIEVAVHGYGKGLHELEVKNGGECIMTAWTITDTEK
jgi:hypothetical protein